MIRKQAADELFGIELHQVFKCFSDSDITDRQAEFVRQLQYDAAFTESAKELNVTATATDDSVKSFVVDVRIDTPKEVEYFQHGGILQYVLRQLASS